MAIENLGTGTSIGNVTNTVSGTTNVYQSMKYSQDAMQRLINTAEKVCDNIKVQINRMDIQLNEKTPNWQGTEAATYRERFNYCLEKLYNAINWLSAFSYDLKKDLQYRQEQEMQTIAEFNKI